MYNYLANNYILEKVNFFLFTSPTLHGSDVDEYDT